MWKSSSCWGIYYEHEGTENYVLRPNQCSNTTQYTKNKRSHANHHRSKTLRESINVPKTTRKSNVKQVHDTWFFSSYLSPYPELQIIVQLQKFKNSRISLSKFHCNVNTRWKDLSINARPMSTCSRRAQEHRKETTGDHIELMSIITMI